MFVFSASAGLHPALAAFRAQEQLLPTHNASARNARTHVHLGRAHKFYVSLAQADYNEKTQTLEVAIRMFADDLELALTKSTRRAVYLDTTPDIANLIRAYLQERFEVRGRDGKIRELKWIGTESSVDSAWVYIEIPLGKDINGAEIRNRILLDLYREQVNTTIVKATGKQHTFIFKNGDDAWRMIRKQ